MCYNKRKEMKTKEQIYNFVVGQSYDALAERVCGGY